jgi:H+/Cl- antiporter ClcA
LILAGGAAGIAAAFNTPLAGIIFAIEELSRSFEERTSGMVITTVLVAGIVSSAALGNYTYFGHAAAALDLMQAWKPVLLCGLVGGLAGGCFSRLLILFSRGISGPAGLFIEEKPVLFAALCGLALAVLGQFCGHAIFGTGYEEAKGLIEGTSHLSGSFGLMKLVATVVSYISGLPGGLFAPSLAVGAGFGANMIPWMPDVPAVAVILLGMIGYFTGVVQVPLTATIIVMEMTDEQSLTLPLMATAFIACAASRLVCPTPLYRSLAQSFLESSKRRTARLAAGQTP